MLINGVSAESISARDRGLAYGDGHFTTLLIQEGRARYWPEHLARLQQGCTRLAISPPCWTTLAAELDTLIADQALAVAKIVLTRGEGGRGYDGTGCQQTSRILSLAPYPMHYQDWQRTGISIGVCQQRIGDSPMLAGLKTLNRLEQVLLKDELAKQGAVEGIVLNCRGFLVEGVSANLFWRRGSTVFTPDLGHGGVDGIMRRQVMSLLRQMGIELRIVEAPLESLWQAEEVWLTNTLMGLVPVTRIEHKEYDSQQVVHRLQEQLLIEV